MTPKEFTKKLEAAGWVQIRQESSHRIFRHPDFKENISLPDHGKRDIKPGTLSKLMKKAGLK